MAVSKDAEIVSDEVTHDLIVIGAGAAGEAAGTLGAELGGQVAVVERDLVGGECAFWACMPSKSLLDSAHRRRLGAEYSWQKASDRRDWMISREGTPYPSDASHAGALEGAGADIFRGTARIVGRGAVEVQKNGKRPILLKGRNIVIATGSFPFIPMIYGVEEVGYWTNREATSLRHLPSSIAIVGAGPVGVELAQVYARFGVKVHLIEKYPRILIRDHHRSSETLEKKLLEEGVAIYKDNTAIALHRGSKGRVIHLSDGTTVEAAEVLIAVGRVPDLSSLGLEEYGVELIEGKQPPAHDETMRIAEGLYVAGDAAGGLQFTHVADYQGRVVARNALGIRSSADLSAVPKTTFTDPETSAIGLTLEQAQDRGIDAIEVTQDFATTARGYSIEGSFGHVSAVVDRERRHLVGAFAACPGASELIMEAVLAIKQSIPVEVLADAIHPFPTASRVFGNLMADAAKQMSKSNLAA